MLVSEVMTANPVLVDTDYTVLEVAKVMRDEDCGILPVMDNNKAVGVITDRDVVLYAVADEKTLETTQVTEVMSEDVIICKEDEFLEDIANRMSINGVRRLVVLNDQDIVSGIVSLHDLMVNIGDEKVTDEVVHNLLKYA